MYELTNRLTDCIGEGTSPLHEFGKS